MPLVIILLLCVAILATFYKESRTQTEQQQLQTAPSTTWRAVTNGITATFTKIRSRTAMYLFQPAHYFALFFYMEHAFSKVFTTEHSTRTYKCSRQFNTIFTEFKRRITAMFTSQFIIKCFREIVLFLFYWTITFWWMYILTKTGADVIMFFYNIGIDRAVLYFIYCIFPEAKGAVVCAKFSDVYVFFLSILLRSLLNFIIKRYFAGRDISTANYTNFFVYHSFDYFLKLLSITSVFGLLHFIFF